MAAKGISDQRRKIGRRPFFALKAWSKAGKRFKPSFFLTSD